MVFLWLCFHMAYPGLGACLGASLISSDDGMLYTRSLFLQLLFTPPLRQVGYSMVSSLYLV
jgi:hypothetical protein